MTTSLHPIVQQFLDNPDADGIALAFDAVIHEFNLRARELHWAYGEVLWHFRHNKLYKRILDPDTDQPAYDTLDQYLSNAKLPFGRTWAYLLMRVYGKFKVELQISDDSELGQLISQVTNFEMLAVIAGILPPNVQLDTIKYWVIAAIEAPNIQALYRRVEKETGVARSLPEPKKVVIEPSRRIERWHAEQAPSADELFGDIPPNAIVDIIVRIVGYEDEESETT